MSAIIAAVLLAGLSPVRWVAPVDECRTRVWYVVNVETHYVSTVDGYKWRCSRVDAARRRGLRR